MSSTLRRPDRGVNAGYVPGVRYDPRPMSSRALCFSLALSLTGAAHAASPAPVANDVPLAAIEADIERARREFEIPGVAVAVVKDGRVVVAKGYGVKRQGAPAPVDADTLFAIASNTKAFTAAALGLLVE